MMTLSMITPAQLASLKDGLAGLTMEALYGRKGEMEVIVENGSAYVFTPKGMWYTLEQEPLALAAKLAAAPRLTKVTLLGLGFLFEGEG